MFHRSIFTRDAPSLWTLISWNFWVSDAPQGDGGRIKPGDLLVCYLTRVSRWCGLLEVVDGPFIDDTPLFAAEKDPFVVRFHVRPKVWLDIENSIPIHDDRIWEGLSFTRDLEKTSGAWTGKVRGSLVRLDDRDGKFLAEQLLAQLTKPQLYLLDEHDTKKLATHTVNRPDKIITVSAARFLAARERPPC